MSSLYEFTPEYNLTFFLLTSYWLSQFSDIYNNYSVKHCEKKKRCSLLMELIMPWAINAERLGWCTVRMAADIYLNLGDKWFNTKE